MTAADAFELTTGGGTTDFERVIRLCEQWGPYCLIGGLAVNCYAEPVYTLDADLVLQAASFVSAFASAEDKLREEGFTVEWQEHTVNVQAPGSQLRVQFTRDERYQAFPGRANQSVVLGVRARVASLEDVTQGKLWAFADRRLSQRRKDELDLIRLAEQHPQLLPLYPQELQKLFRNDPP